jgi:hypothetical protein
VPLSLLLALALTGPRAAHAQDRLEVPAACATSAELESELTKLLGDPAVGARPYVKLDTLGEAGYRLEVETSHGLRSLRDPDCRVLFRAAVLIVALEVSEARGQPLDPASIPTEAAAASAPPATTTVTLPRPSTPEPKLERASRQATPAGTWLGFLGGRAGVALGPVPGLSLSLGLDLLLARERPATPARRGRWGLRLQARYLLPREHQNRLEQGVRVDAFGASCLLSYEPLPAIGLAGGLHGLGLRGVGAANLERQLTDIAWLWGPRAELAWRFWRGQRLTLELALAGLYFVDRARFQVRDGGLVYKSPHWAAEAVLGVQWRFL